MKVKKLVVDSNAFFERIPLWEFGEEFFTLQEVIDEIRDRHTRQHIDSLPFELHRRDPLPESVKFINDFTKKTGDFPSLSLVDIKLLALTYELEKIAKGGASHLRSVPVTERTEVLASRKPPPSHRSDLPEGFFCPRKKASDVEQKCGEICQDESPGLRVCPNSETSKNLTSQNTSNDINNDNDHLMSNKSITCERDKYSEHTNTINLDKLELNDELINIDNDKSNKEFKDDCTSVNNEEYNVTDKSKGDEEYNEDAKSKEEEIVDVEDEAYLVEEECDSCTESDSEEDEDDGGGWITPQNLHAMKKLKDNEGEDVGTVDVACMTTDFAMQNTLRHIGLEVVGFNGKLIRNKKTFTLRCFACYKITNKMDRMFCPHCGHKTLQRVTVTLQPDGSQKIWLSTRRLNNTRGTKFSLPTPQTGKHAVNPILVADQRLCHDKPSKKMIKKMHLNPLGEDYTTGGNRPFGVRDIYSRSSLLGVNGQHTHRGTFYWEQKNPNESKKNMSRRKKKA